MHSTTNVGGGVESPSGLSTLPAGERTHRPGPVLEARDVHVRFGGVHALKGVDIALTPGRVHALLGENGAGKSTLINCIAGALTPTAGQLRVDGAPVELRSPADAAAHGISVIHQELELAAALPVAENVMIGRLPLRLTGVVDRAELLRRAREALRDIGPHIDVRARAGDLEVADQQLVEIAKALGHGGTRVLVMDEPTAALPPAQIERLLDLVRRIAARGVAVLYVSHRLDEVLAIADEISVLRDGRLVRHCERTEATHRSIVADIVGHLPEPVDRAAPDAGGEIVLETEGFAAGVVEELSARVRTGEVVGFFGLLGAGQQTLAEALFGLCPAAARRFSMLGATSVPGSPRRAIAAGVGFVPADRKAGGLALGLSLTENYLLGASRRGRFGVVAPRREHDRARAALRAARVAMRSVTQCAKELSGGNQQKIVLARWMDRPDTRFLLLTEPTRGVDVGAKTEIHRDLRAWVRAEGTARAAALFSADPEETASVCDRVYVLAKGRVVAELTGSEITEAALTAAALEAPLTDDGTSTALTDEDHGDDAA
ncbi:monosaccharide ABC transporter ATP-binding protein, CUT2 family [Pseudonocardia thermophila]|jgi:ABC-type sugar transport system, ATPase component|uniref:Monosaccharide ABC transporter ATP-binding protein, CUT2 family n=1 Tax=Pseudonocardia thermophila TaxID=1848 RepID=A0A1M6XLT4_PSETH|nr:sugar ABC transporter ATP-binding protein [Pseudonocardia thermophila]SHL06755.1 monosaccharide ABC transporter ATP-binding protein, CUT2 family [Pseudonocardia thermophila]